LSFKDIFHVVACWCFVGWNLEFRGYHTRLYWGRPSPVWSELERWLGSEWFELGVQGLSYRVVWRIHRERPSPVRSELERRPGSEWLVLRVQGLSHRVIWRKHRERPSPVRSELEQRPGSKWLVLRV
jgi:hypothetical protein